MPTTFTGGDLKVAASQSIVNISETLLATNAFSIKVDTSGLALNDTTQVFVVGAAPDAAAFNRDTNNYMTDNGGAHAWKPVTLDTHKKLTFKIPPKEFNKLTTTDLANLYKPYVSKLCDTIIKSAFEKITAANFATNYNIANTAAFDRVAVSKAETALAKLVGTSGERNLVVGMDAFSVLRESLAGMYVSPANGTALIQGNISGVSGFANVIRTTAFAAPAANYMFGIATNKSGIAMAFIPVEVTSQFDGEREVVSDPVTGIPLTFSVDYSKETRDYVATVECIWGSGVMDGKGILRLTATAA